LGCLPFPCNVGTLLVVLIEAYSWAGASVGRCQRASRHFPEGADAFYSELHHSANSPRLTYQEWDSGGLGSHRAGLPAAIGSVGALPSTFRDRLSPAPLTSEIIAYTN
jgi:hypothetical protein